MTDHTRLLDTGAKGIYRFTNNPLSGKALPWSMLKYSALPTADASAAARRRPWFARPAA